MNKPFDGILNVCKPEGITSQGVVTKVKRALSEKTAGHCGTLDPLATGVLPVMVGRSVKASEYLISHDKRYVAGVTFGIETDTQDTTGTVICRYDGILPTLRQVRDVLPMFTGKIKQLPPMYSAIKIGGRKLVDAARMGVEIEREPREITVYELSAFEKEGKIFLDVICSRGTYVRTLVSDIGKALGCLGAMSSLCRKSVGSVEKGVYVPKFSVENALPLEKLLEMTDEEKESLITGEIGCVTFLGEIFSHLPKIVLPEFYDRLFKNGCIIDLKKLSKNTNTALANEEIFAAWDENGFYALGEVVFSEGVRSVKLKKRFRLY